MESWTLTTKKKIVSPFVVDRGPPTEEEWALVKQWGITMRSTVVALRTAVWEKVRPWRRDEMGYVGQVSRGVRFWWGGRGMGGYGWDTRAPWGSETLGVEGHVEDVDIWDGLSAAKVKGLAGPTNFLYQDPSECAFHGIGAWYKEHRPEYLKYGQFPLYHYSEHEVTYTYNAAIKAYTGASLNRNKWPYVKHAPGVYPWQSAVDLIEAGLFPIFDRQLWRLHAGKDKVWVEKDTKVWILYSHKLGDAIIDKKSPPDTASTKKSVTTTKRKKTPDAVQTTKPKSPFRRVIKRRGIR